MNVDELFVKLQGLLKEELKAEREQTKILVHEEIQGIEDRLGKRIDSVEARLSEKIDKVQESVDIVQSVVVEEHDKLEERVTAIEKNLRISEN